MSAIIKAAGMSAVVLSIAVSVTPARDLSFDERVAAQVAIEQVYWSHRIWPKDNPGPKPLLPAAVSDVTIRAKVDDYLRKSNALESWWRRPLSAEQLQAELDRMAANSRGKATLRQLFEALGNDPFVIAQTLARQTLVERLLPNWYASDARFHGDLRKKAESALAACASVDCMKTIGGTYRETTWRRRAEHVEPAVESAADGAIDLDADAWTEHLKRLASKLGVDVESIPVRQRGILEETPEAFVVTAVLALGDGELTTASVAWPKRSFTAWWDAQRGEIGPEIEAISGTLTLPSVPTTACTNDTWSATSFEVPDPRKGYTAVWTGAEMIVWGGLDSSNTPVNTGGRYNPSTDSWTLTSTGANVPAARWTHTAVWTGTEMIVWGGSPLTASGGRYDPGNDAWTAVSTGASVPVARAEHTAVWTGTEMIVWGGVYYEPTLGDYFPTRSGGRYAPSTDSWTATLTGASAPTARHLHTAVWTGTEMIVWGGWDGTNENTGGRYVPSTNSWMPTSTGANVPVARARHTVVWTGTEMIVWGGTGGLSLNSGGRYNPSTNAWSPTSTPANAPSARQFHTAVWTGTEMIVWGGSNGGDLDTGGRYNPGTDAWTPTSTAVNAPGARSKHAAVWTGTEMIVWSGEGVGDSNTGARYTPSTDSWLAVSTGATVPAARHSHSLLWTGTEMIVWGGNNGSRLDSGWRYAPSTDTWTPTAMGGGAPSARDGHKAVWTGTEMIVWGGSDGSYLSTGARYRPSSDTWLTTSVGLHVPAARARHTAVWTGTEMIVWGGFNGSPMNTGGRYNPSSDSWTATSTGASVPDARYSHTAVWTGTQMIVWGGYLQPTFLNTGARYLPATDSWIATSTGANVPAGRYGHTGVWTGTELIVWGGNGQGGVLGTGGRFNPSTASWTTTSTGVNAPAARSGHTAVWTEAEMIVWGGAGNTGGRYDPSNDIWTTTSTGTGVPSGRSAHAVSWTGREMIVWGGSPLTASGGQYCACPGGGTYFRDADGDGYGNHAVAVAVCAAPIPTGHVADSTDCDDANATKNPGVAELCDGIDNNCDAVVPPNEADADGDGVRTCGGDCNDGNPLVRPGAPEVNDGLDNQCPGDPGHGSIDELSGSLGFFTAGDKTKLSWPAQSGATGYEIARSPFRDFHAGCAHATTASLAWSDPAIPPLGIAYYYLVRTVAPRIGSWGQRSAGIERIVCAGCVATGDWCDDGTVCTVGDVCTGGVCGGAPLSCDDANPCTDDSCDPLSGCEHVDNANACDDGSSCTSGDTCQGGVCVGSVPNEADHLVISQFQLAGSGSGDQFVEIYNPTTSPVPLSGLSLQFRRAGLFTSYAVHPLGSGAVTQVPARGWVLLATSGYDGTPPRDELITEFAMNTSPGFIALVNGTTSLGLGCNPTAPSVIDHVSYGSTSCAEGNSATAAPSANDSRLRKPGGACGNGADTNRNGSDFVSQTPSTPRNSASPPQP